MNCDHALLHPEDLLRGTRGIIKDAPCVKQGAVGMKKILKTPRKAPSDIMLGDVMPAFPNTVCDPRQSKFDGRQPQKKQMKLIAVLFHFSEKILVGFSGQSCLKREIDFSSGAIRYLVEQDFSRFNRNP